MTRNYGAKNTKNKMPNSNPPMITDFGFRAVSNQNFSKMVALPKTALANCCSEETTKVNVQLVQQNGEKFIKLTPICNKEKGEEKN